MSEGGPQRGGAWRWARCAESVRRLLILIGAAVGLTSPAAGDVYRVSVPPEISPAHPDGRLILFFIDEAGGHRLRGAQPAGAPFFMAPQPVASTAVSGLAPGGVVEVHDDAVAWPVPLNELDGSFRVQAVFKCSRDDGSHLAAGNLLSEPMRVELGADRDDVVELTLSRQRAAPPRENPDPEMGDHLVWISMRSELLSSHFGRDMFLRAGVALPPGYHDVDHPRRMWPTIYVVPGFGERDLSARSYARMLHTPGVEAIAPHAVYVVLDPQGPFGHHGFADSECNGPVGSALVQELAPFLESRFRLVRRPEARLITGHSSGGWAALWQLLHAPETFGACWASAPDPVDFTAFQRTNLYADENLFVEAAADGEAQETPSFRTPVAPGIEKVRMTARQEVGVEHAMAPRGDSGQQWGAWMAAFSSRDPASGGPRWVADPISGRIDRSVVERDWSRYDIARLIASDWERLSAILPRVRIACGTQDSFYLNRAVNSLRNLVARRQAAAGAAPAPMGESEPGETPFGAGPGYIWMVPHASHESIVPLTTLRWNQEMREHLRQHGLMD